MTKFVVLAAFLAATPAFPQSNQHILTPWKNPTTFPGDTKVLAEQVKTLASQIEALSPMTGLFHLWIILFLPNLNLPA